MTKHATDGAAPAGRPGRRPALPAPVTPDGRYLVVRGRLWRRANPALAEAVRVRGVSDLMAARRAVGQALRAHDEAALRDARRAVDEAKHELGERGPTWWSDAPDFNRRSVLSSPYAAWFKT